MLVHPVQAQQSRDEPADGRQERKRLVRLPGAAVAAAEAQPTPVEGGAAAVVQPVYDEAEGNKPADREDQVGGPVDEAVREGQEPEEGEEDGQPRDDLGVDEAAQGP